MRDRHEVLGSRAALTRVLQDECFTEVRRGVEGASVRMTGTMAAAHLNLPPRWPISRRGELEAAAPRDVTMPRTRYFNILSRKSENKRRIYAHCILRMMQIGAPA